MFNFYHWVPRRLKILLLFFLIIIAAYLLFYFSAPENKTIPEEFLRARQEASLIAEEIIAISETTADNINRISGFNRTQYQEASDIISFELLRNREAREKAIGLSEKLTTMTKNIPAISPSFLAQTALEAISSETALISRLITYNDYLVNLLEILQRKFNDPKSNQNDKIGELINKINEETKAINELDGKFNELMTEFDKIVP